MKTILASLAIAAASGLFAVAPALAQPGTTVEQPNSPKARAAVKPKGASDGGGEQSAEDDLKALKKLPKAKLTAEQSKEFDNQKLLAEASRKLAKVRVKDATSEVVSTAKDLKPATKARDAAYRTLQKQKNAVDAAEAGIGRAKASPTELKQLKQAYNASVDAYMTGPRLRYQAAETAAKDAQDRLTTAKGDYSTAQAGLTAVEYNKVAQQRQNYLNNKAAKNSVYGPLPQISPAAKQSIYSSAGLALNGGAGVAPNSDYGAGPGPRQGPVVGGVYAGAPPGVNGAPAQLGAPNAAGYSQPGVPATGRAAQSGQLGPADAAGYSQPGVPATGRAAPPAQLGAPNASGYSQPGVPATGRAAAPAAASDYSKAPGAPATGRGVVVFSDYSKAPGPPATGRAGAVKPSGQ